MFTEFTTLPKRQVVMRRDVAFWEELLPMKRLPKFEETPPVAEELELPIEANYQRQIAIVGEKTPEPPAGIPIKPAARNERFELLTKPNHYKKNVSHNLNYNRIQFRLMRKKHYMLRHILHLKEIGHPQRTNNCDHLLKFNMTI